jgi:hypothetical protein
VRDKIKNYMDEARKRGERRKSPWNFILIPAALIPAIAFYVAFIRLLENVHLQFFPAQHLMSSANDTLAKIAVMVLPLFASMIVGMLVGNYLINKVPFLRCIFDREAREIAQASYKISQKSLLGALFFILLPSLGGSFLCSFFSWQ